MSLLPGRILPQSESLGRVNADGTVTIDKNWWLLLYNLCNQTLATGGSFPTDQLIDLASADSDAIDADAIALRSPLSNALKLSMQPEDVVINANEIPAIAKALKLAQDCLLPDPTPQAQPSSSITVSASPFSYTAPFNGTVSVTAGTVSLIQIIRQGTTIATGLTAGILPLSRLDQIKVTYTGAPTMVFLPS